MTNAALEERIIVLEEKVATILKKVIDQPREKDWRSTIGMFDDDPMMKEIDEEGHRLRHADREQEARDSS